MKITKNQLVLIPCTIGHGGFPHDRTFSIPSDEDRGFRRGCDASHCLGSDLEPLGEYVPPVRGGCIAGYVKGLVIDVIDGDLARVQVPSGDIVELPISRIAYIGIATPGWVKVCDAEGSETV